MDLRDSIIRTVSYFDLFDFPLTRAEVWRWLFATPATLGETETAIDSLVAEGKIKEEQGVVCLHDRTDLPAVRESRYRESARKWRRARRWSRVFAALPGVELVGVGNTLAFHGARDSSDIDFFIVSKPGTLWRTRFFAAGLAALFGLRPRPSDSRDKLCLSFFVSTDALDISKLSSSDDIYLKYWTAQMVPLAGTDEMAEKYWAANTWVRDSLPNVQSRSRIGAPSVLRYLFLPLMYLPGSLFKDQQKKRFPLELRDALNKHDGSVVVSDSVLKFHVNDRRAALRERWVARVAHV